MDWTLEVVVVPVSDVDRAIAFYHDADPDGNAWVVQQIKARADTPLIPRWAAPQKNGPGWTKPAGTAGGSAAG